MEHNEHAQPILPPGHFNAMFWKGKLYTDNGELCPSLMVMDAHGNYRLVHKLGFHASPLQDGQVVQLPDALEIYVDRKLSN